MDHESSLPSGFRFEEYEIVRVLGAGGFGITYLGYDHHLDKPVAVKEYLPSELAIRKGDTSVVAKSSGDTGNFDWGLERFLEEARVLARFDEPNLPKVYRYFHAHGTGYIVMEYVEGETLSELYKRKGSLSEPALKELVDPLLTGLSSVHAAGFLHRDIKPSNIVIRDNGTPVLIDFGSARAALGVKSRSVTSIVTPGYAPLEQYSTKGKQGPWTDIYALGAVLYRGLTGKVPDDATDRILSDELEPLAGGTGDDLFRRAVDWALQVREEDRPQSIEAWRSSWGNAIQDAKAASSSNATVTSSKFPRGTQPSVSHRLKGGASKTDQRLTAGILAILGLMVSAGIILYLADYGSVQPHTARLYVNVSPVTADVQVQETGRAKQTPYKEGMRIEKEQKYTITASAPGHESQTRTAYVSSSENVARIQFRLERLSNVSQAVDQGAQTEHTTGDDDEQTAGLYIYYLPASAQVRVAKKDSSYRDYVSGMKVERGSVYEIWGYADGYKPFNKTISVDSSDSKINVSFEMEKVQHTDKDQAADSIPLYINASPSNAHTRIKPSGGSYIPYSDGMRLETGTSYRIDVSAPNHEEKTFVKYLFPHEEIARVDVTLNRKNNDIIDRNSQKRLKERLDVSSEIEFRARIKEFQRANDLEASGDIDEDTNLVLWQMGLMQDDVIGRYDDWYVTKFDYEDKMNCEIITIAESYSPRDYDDRYGTEPPNIGFQIEAGRDVVWHNFDNSAKKGYYNTNAPIQATVSYGNGRSISIPVEFGDNEGIKTLEHEDGKTFVSSDGLRALTKGLALTLKGVRPDGEVVDIQYSLKGYVSAVRAANQACDNTDKTAWLIKN